MEKSQQELNRIIERLSEGKELSEHQTETLIAHFLPSIRIKAKRLFIMYPMVDFDDLVSDGLLGFMKAVRYFDSSKNVLFSTFADVCVVNNMRSAVSKALKNSHGMTKQDEFDFDTIPDETLTAEEAIIDREDNSVFFSRLSEELSKSEYETLSLYLAGFSYARIASRLGKDEKSVDNALQRAKAKLKKLLSNRK